MLIYIYIYIYINTNSIQLEEVMTFVHYRIPFILFK